jgi:hypothetical protein
MKTLIDNRAYIVSHNQILNTFNSFRTILLQLQVQFQQVLLMSSHAAWKILLAIITSYDIAAMQNIGVAKKKFSGAFGIYHTGLL